MKTTTRLLSLCASCFLLAATAMLGTGCDLPQDGNKTPDPTAPGTPTTGSYSYVRIIDTAGTSPTSQPGADIDAIVVLAGGETFLSAGCQETSLFGEDKAVHGENVFLDPAKGTLSFKEESEGYGFVSLGGGTLFCELPIPVQSGDVITIYEMEADKKDSYRVVLAEAPADGETVELGTFTGTARIDIP